MKKSANGKAPLFSLKYLFYDFVKVTAVLPGLIWFRPKIIYVNENAKKRIRGGALVISNHLGFFDPLYLQFGIWYRRHHFICLKEFFESRASWLFKSFLCIPIDKHNFSINSFREIIEHLDNGELVTMFPEGRVNGGSGELNEFKSGMILMALRSKKPIVPVYIYPKRKFYSRLKMVVGESVDVCTMYGNRPTFSQIDSMAELLRQREDELKSYIK